MRVLQLGPYPPPEGGVSRNMLAIRDELLARGHECDIIATARSSDESDVARVYRPRSPLELLQLLRLLPYDVLHLHIGGEVSRRVLAMAFACTVLGRGKKVVTLHSGAYPLTDEGRSARTASVRGSIFRRFDRVIAVNEALMDVFRRYGVDDERVRMILPYGLSRPDVSVEMRPDLAEFCAKHSPLLLAVGGLEPDYDPLFQIAAMGEILAQFPNAGLMIVGDGSMRDAVKKAAAASRHAGHICIAGNVPHAVTLQLIEDADVLIRTTLFDGDAISIREAIFLGTPVIATDNGMRPEGVHLINAGDAAGLAAKLRSALEQKTTKHSGHAEDNANIASVIELYSEILA